MVWDHHSQHYFGPAVIIFPFGATPPLIGEAEEAVAAEPLGAFNRDPNDLVFTVGGRLVVNHLLDHDFLSGVQLDSLLEDLDRVPLTEKAPIFNENPPIVGRPQDFGTCRTVYGNYGTCHSIALLLMSKSPGILNGKCLGTCSDTPKAIPNMLGDLLSGHRKNPKRFPERPQDESQAISRAAPG